MGVALEDWDKPRLAAMFAFLLALLDPIDFSALVGFESFWFTFPLALMFVRFLSVAFLSSSLRLFLMISSVE
jgi:hypothetical protein